MKKSQKNKLYLIMMSVSVIAGLLLSVWVCQSDALKQKVNHRCATTNQTFQTGPVTDTKAAVQQFVPLYEDLESLEIIISRQGGAAVDGTIRVTVYSDGGDLSGMPGHIYATAERPVAELKSDSYEEFILNAKLEIGNTYWFSVETVQGGEVIPTVVYRPMVIDRMAENQCMFYEGMELPGASAACGYNYRLPLTKLQIVTYTVFCVFLTMLAGSCVYVLINAVKEKWRKE